jgi:sugar transferase (PEP-CTERM/EpsH1 system associated)
MVAMSADKPPPLRVVHLVSTLNIGGLEMVVVNLMQWCDRSKIEPHVICLGETGALADQISALGIPVESLSASGKVSGRRRLWRLARRLRALRPHVLHTHNPAPHWTGALAAQLARVPVLVHTKHGRNYAHRWRAVLTNRVASGLSDCIVPVSEDAAQVALDVEHTPPHKLRVIRNGVDVERYTHRAKRCDAPGLRAVTVARLNPIKDQATMLRATRLVVEQEPGFQLEIVGDGQERERLTRLVEELGLHKHVVFHGFRDDVPAFLGGQGFFVLSSVSEGISLTLLEAMAVGLPVVATDVGGNREVVASGETGWLVPPRSPERLAEAMLRFVRDPSELAAFGAAARERVEQHFDLRRVVAQYEALYWELWRRKSGAPAGLLPQAADDLTPLTKSVPVR